MDPAVTVDMRRNADGGVRQLRCVAVAIKPKLHMDTCKIRDRAPCPIALDPICGSLIGHVDLLPGQGGLIRVCSHMTNKTAS